MKYQLIVPGKIKPDSLLPAYNDYFSRLKKRLRLSIEEIKPERIDKRPQDKIKSLEGERMLKQLDADDYVVVLDEKGKRLSSETMADRLRFFSDSPKHRIVFVIGGALGLSEPVKKRADEQWRLSELTLAGGVARLVLLEALYRADTINKNEPYHNA